MLAAEWGTGQVFWSILWFFLFFLWIALVFSVFADIMRAREMSGWAKAMWTFAIIFMPFLGVFLYLVVNGRHMDDRAERAVAESDEALRSYIQQTVAQGPADQLASLAALHEAGKLSDDEFAAAKQKVTNH